MTVKDLMIFVTNRCNLKCDYCFVDANFSNQKELTVEEIKEAIDIIKPTRVVHLTGGEPFLRYDDIIEIAEYALERVPSVVINTNGTILDKDLTKIKNLKGKEVCLIISLDGFKENHDRACGVDGTFEKVLEFSKKALELGLNIQVKTTLPNDLINNEKYCQDFSFFCRGFGFKRMMLGNVFGVGRGREFCKTQEKWKLTQQEHIELYSKTESINNYILPCEDNLHLFKKGKYVLPQFCIRCSLERNDAILLPDGTVKAECCFLDFPMGHYKDFTLDKFEAKLNEMREMRDSGIDVRSK